MVTMNKFKVTDGIDLNSGKYSEYRFCVMDMAAGRFGEVIQSRSGS